MCVFVNYVIYQTQIYHGEPSHWRWPYRNSILHTCALSFRKCPGRVIENKHFNECSHKKHALYTPRKELVIFRFIVLLNGAQHSRKISQCAQNEKHEVKKKTLNDLDLKIKKTTTTLNPTKVHSTVQISLAYRVSEQS